MRWTCPHCTTGLALSDEVASNTTKDPWRLIACYRCGGFSMIQNPVALDSTQKPRVLSARRGGQVTTQSSPPDSAPKRAAAAGLPPPVPEIARLTAGQRDPSSQIKVQALSTPLAGPEEPSADFRRLQSKWNSERKKRSVPFIALQTSPRAWNRSAPARRWAPISVMLVFVTVSGALLIQQGLKLNQSVARLEQSPAQSIEAPGNDFTDEIRSTRAAPERPSNEPAAESGRYIEAD